MSECFDRRIALFIYYKHHRKKIHPVQKCFMFWHYLFKSRKNKSSTTAGEVERQLPVLPALPVSCSCQYGKLLARWASILQIIKHFCNYILIGFCRFLVQGKNESFSKVAAVEGQLPLQSAPPANFSCEGLFIIFN